MPFRRDLQTILAAHDLDPDRCDLFVEGEEDRRVLLWLVGEAVNPGAVITSVEHIDVEISEGGNRERLVEIARRLEGGDACVLCFIDTGLGQQEGDEFEKLVTTDGPDLESYVLQEECVEKFLRLGLRTDAWDSSGLLAISLQRVRRLGFLRVASERREWNLPFQRTALHRHVTVSVGSDISIDEQSLVQALLQNAGTSVTMRDEVIRECDKLEDELSDMDDHALAHGKDVFCLFGEVAKSEGRQRQEARGLLWASLERRMVESQESLRRVLRFLEYCCGAEPTMMA